MADSSHKDTEEAYIAIEQLLEALEQLGDELAARKPSHLDFRVTIHQNLPSVKLLEEMINQISDDWKNHVQAENVKNNHRSQELSHAYEALQIKNDDILRDIEAARRIQLQLLPQQTDNYHRDELEFAAFYHTKDKVGGDLYDLIRIGKNAYGLLIADVSGHGIPSALLTMFLKAAFRSYSRWGVGSNQICQEVNHVLHPIVSDLGFFATVFFGIVDLETSLFHYTNCGHPYALLRRQGEEEVQELGINGGGILGPFKDVELTQEELMLQDGDTILAFTDGISEARNFLDQMFEEKRLSQAFAESFKKIDINHPMASQIIEQITKALQIFTMGAPADDDQTLAVLRFHHKLVPHSYRPHSNKETDRSRHYRSLISQLRSSGFEAFQAKDYVLAESLLRAVLLLENPKSFDTLLLALIYFHTNRQEQALNHARLVLKQASFGSRQEKLAQKIIEKVTRRLS